MKGLINDYEYGNGEMIRTYPCPQNCDKGLIMAPVRFCNMCRGAGYLAFDLKPNIILGEE